MSGFADAVDSVIEAPVVTSFTKIGYGVRKAVDDWTPLSEYDLRGRRVVITGPTSGLGESAAEWFARLGADLVLVARNETKVDALRRRLVATSGNESITTAIADLGADDFQVRDASSEALGELFPESIPALREAATSETDEEILLRVERLLEEAEDFLSDAAADEAPLLDGRDRVAAETFTLEGVVDVSFGSSASRYRPDARSSSSAVSADRRRNR